MYDPKAFGKFLLEKRKAKKITLAQLGQRTGVDAGFLSRMERGESKSPSADTLAKIADGLGIKRELVFYVAGVSMRFVTPMLLCCCFLVKIQKWLRKDWGIRVFPLRWIPIAMLRQLCNNRQPTN